MLSLQMAVSGRDLESTRGPSSLTIGIKDDAKLDASFFCPQRKEYNPNMINDMPTKQPSVTLPPKNNASTNSVKINDKGLKTSEDTLGPWPPQQMKSRRMSRQWPLHPTPLDKHILKQK